MISVVYECPIDGLSYEEFEGFLHFLSGVADDLDDDYQRNLEPKNIPVKIEATNTNALNILTSSLRAIPL